MQIISYGEPFNPLQYNFEMARKQKCTDCNRDNDDNYDCDCDDYDEEEEREIMFDDPNCGGCDDEADCFYDN